MRCAAVTPPRTAFGSPTLPLQGRVNKKPTRRPSMPLQIPLPHLTFDVPLDDGARIRVRRHGNPEGVRLFLSHGNGYAINGYLPYWQHFLDRFDLIIFDFRNLRVNEPRAPSNHNYAQLSRDLERVYQYVTA